MPVDLNGENQFGHANHLLGKARTEEQVLLGVGKEGQHVFVAIATIACAGRKVIVRRQVKGALPKAKRRERDAVLKQAAAADVAADDAKGPRRVRVVARREDAGDPEGTILYPDVNPVNRQFRVHRIGNRVQYIGIRR